MSEFERLVDAAKAAIDKVMSCMDVQSAENRAALRDIRDHASICLDALESDAEPDEA